MTSLGLEGVDFILSDGKAGLVGQDESVGGRRPAFGYNPPEARTMILHVDYGQFASTVKRLLQTQEAYVRSHAGTTVVTAGHPGKNCVVAAVLREPIEAVRARLAQDSFEVFDGEWTDAGESAGDRMGERQTYVAAVAYNSREKMPGIWVDAYSAPPVPGLVLRTFYDELAENGEIGEFNFEEFVRLANPNVVIIGPNEIQGFLNEKEGC